MTDSLTYYIRLRGIQKGPYAVEKLKKLAQTGQFTRAHQVSSDGRTWTLAEAIPELFPARVTAVKKESSEKLESVNTSTTETVASPTKDEIREWQYAIGQQQYGPSSLEELRLMYQAGQLKGSTLIWKKGLRDWLPLRDVIILPRKRGITTRTYTVVAAVVLLIATLAVIGIAMQKGLSSSSVPVVSSAANPPDPQSTSRTGSVLTTPEASASVSTVFENLPTVSLPLTSDDEMSAPSPLSSPVVSTSSRPISSSDLTNPAVSLEYDQAVGIVISYLEITQENGSRTELTLGHGTGFLVNSEGTMLTNKHVIDDYSNWESATKSGRVERLHQLHLRQFEEIVSRLEASDREKLTIFQEAREELARIKDGVEEISPRLAVYFGDERYSAELEYMSYRFDLAVLKTPCRGRSFFALSQENRQPKLSDVMSLGFPGISMEPISEAARDVQTSVQSRTSLLFGSRSFTDAFKAKTFEMTATLGVVNLVQEEIAGVFNVQHSATIRQGNSGGPLVLRTGASNGVVYAINTLGIRDQLASSNVAFPVAQMRSELETSAHVTGLVWK